MESVDMMNNEEKNREDYLISLADDIVKMTDSVIGVIGKIVSLSAEEHKIVKEWYEQLAGHELDIVRDAIDVRRNAIDYLKSKNIHVPDDPTYEVEQFNPMSRDDFFKNWNNFDSENGRRR